MNKRKLNVDKMADMRFENDEPFRPYHDTIEYETKDVRNRKKKDTKVSVSPEDMKPRVPVTEEEKQKAELAERFLKSWGV